MLLFTVVKTFFTDVPSVFNIVTAATDTKAAINAYSIMVAPRLSPSNFLKNFI
jgi:hypothetical protein